MISARSYTVVERKSYIEVVNLINADVIIVDRNGIGIKHTSNFAGTSTTESVNSYNWYGVKRGSLASGEYLVPITVSIGATRVVLYEIGATVVSGKTYAVTYGGKVAKYTAQAGDDANDVRNGLDTAIIGETWTGFTVTTSQVSTNRLQVTFSDPAVEFLLYLGQQKWKKGYYTTINSVLYIIDSVENTSTEPSLPTLEVSYNFTDLTAVTISLQNYLREPLSAIEYSTASAGTTIINNTPGSGSVTFGECVLQEAQQRIYFSGNLEPNEIIKVFQK